MQEQEVNNDRSRVMNLDPRIIVNHPGNSPGDPIPIEQSGEKASIQMDLKDCVLKVIYDIASDNVLVQNLGEPEFAFTKVGALPDEIAGEVDNSMHKRRIEFVHRSIDVISPGRWQITSDDDELCEITVLPRTYVLEKHKHAAVEAGTKRRAESDSTSSKRHQNDDGQSALVSLNTFKKDETQVQTTIVNTANALADLNIGESVTIRPTTKASSQRESNQRASSRSGTYTITCHRKITPMEGSNHVFRGTHSDHGDVFVKVKLSDSEQLHIKAHMATAWENERNVMKDLNHPSIVKTFGYDARFFSLYMEYSPHPDLSTRRDHGQFFTGTPTEALRVLRDISSALAYLHNKNLLHHDIKPGSILSSPGKPPILVDFGVASEYKPNSSSSGDGTMFYIPREYLVDERRGPPSDVFALGVTLLYMLRKIPLPESTESRWNIGAVHVDGPDRKAMLAWLKKVGGAAAKLSTAEHNLESVVRGALAMDPKERLSAQQIVEKVKKLEEASTTGLDRRGF